MDLDRPARIPSRSGLWQGLSAGLLLALVDILASGSLRLPFLIITATLVTGFLSGAVAGSAAVLLARENLGPALILALAIGLEGLSTVSKELSDPGARLTGALLVSFLALASGALALARPRTSARGAWTWLALAAVPAGPLAAAVLASGPWTRIGASALVLLVLALERTSARARIAPGLAAAFLALLLAVLPLASGTPGRAATSPAPVAGTAGGRPSVVLLVIDTLRPDALDPGGPIARLGSAGVDFRQAISPAPWTLPAVASLLTGLHPTQHGALTAGNALPGEITTLAECLHAGGYATAAFTGGAFVGSAHALDQGFETFDPSCERRFPAFGPHVPLVWRLARNRYLPQRWFVRAVDEYRGLEGVVDAVRRWGERRERERDRRPFFLFLHTYQVHDYYLYDSPVDDAVLDGAAFSPRFARRLSVHPDELLDASQADLDLFRELYRARVAAVEAALPALEAAVSALGRDDVLWVVTSDHGEGFDASRRRVHHGGRLHDDLLRVPLFLRSPGRLAAGTVVDEQVRTLDILPTVLELAGVPVPDGLAGESLVPALRGERPYPASAFSEEFEHGLELRSLRRGGWKRIEDRSGAELYHVAEDPLETVPTTREPAGELAAELASFPSLYPPRRSESAALDPATREHLRALGY